MCFKVRRRSLCGFKRLVLLLALGLALALAILAASRLLLGPVFIPSESMEPTLTPGDVLLVNRLAYGTGLSWYGATLLQWSSPDKGDIVVFKVPAAARTKVQGYLIKRVVATAGDTLEVRGNKLVLNGAPATYVRSNDYPASTETLAGLAHDVWLGKPLATNFGPVMVPPGSVFLMGDNRDHSTDSRTWGMLSISDIEGRATSLKFDAYQLRNSWHK